jgi:hypothetical protein
MMRLTPNSARYGFYLKCLTLNIRVRYVTYLTPNSCSSGDDDSDDEVLEPTGNANYNRAVDEFSAFERFKKKKYLPVLKKTQQGSLSNNSGDESTMKELFVGPVVSKGKDLPSGKILLTM